MSADARLAILSRVRRAQVRAYIPEARQGLPERMEFPRTASMDAGALRFRLLEEFALLGVEAFVEAGEADVRARVSALIAGKSVLSWDADKLPYGAGACLYGHIAENQKVYYGSDPKADQGQAEIGLTGCENAIAETGTLAMTSGPGRPRTASLMPIAHVAIIRAADIVLGMGEYFRKSREAGSRSGGAPGAMGSMPYVVFITGPSRTADIELSLTLGVHGPGRLTVVIGP